MRSTFLTSILFLSAVVVGNAQPMCSSTFHPLKTCGQHYFEKEFIFVGRVVSEVEDQVWDRSAKKTIVAVEMQIKGNVETQIYLYIDRACSQTVHKGGRHIFAARSVSNKDFTGILSERWSMELEAYTPEEINAIQEKIRSVQSNTKQPPITGRVIQNLVSGSHRLMRALPLNLKLGYDPKNARPLANVDVVAYRKDGKQFITKTNEKGEYSFESLPNGLYEISLDLPEEFRIFKDGDFSIIEDEKKFVEIMGDICERRINFAVEESISDNGGKLMSSPPLPWLVNDLLVSFLMR
ncbi:MAG: carboxypeptidase regulatory-like domain-containing protein [Acidobacteria bacterium]|nr:carboxypeptidase regulatory-like domain-containing protein [Acidobacteriota bacterium]